jgi:hypothetical protein
MTPTSDTICDIARGSIHDGSLFPFQKVNTPQLHVISHFTNTRRTSTLGDVPHDSFYRASSGSLAKRTHILAVRGSPNTGARPASTLSGHKLKFFQSGSLQTHVILSQFPNTNSVFQPTGVHSQTHTHAYTQQFPNTD